MKVDFTHRQPIIGIEIHVELATNSKMFCGCPANHFSVAPNTQTCPVCLGHPGALPVPNKKAVEWTIMLGLATHCKINLESKFDRKHYFYPDLAKGYQISQYDQPLCEAGYVETDLGKVGLTRIHLEEDTGKLQHTEFKGKRVSLVDFNRGGVPLVEIVTDPDIHSAQHAKEYAKNLTQVIRFLGISDADMEKGSMRLEANISWGMDLGYKVEVKNINSFRFLEKAIEFELNRQKEILMRGETPIQETRGFNESKGVTFSQRTKEDAADYRYFPEPDIPPMVFTQGQIDEIKATMPELPEQIQARWESEYKLKPQYYDVLLSDAQSYSYAQEAFTLAQKEKLDVDKIANLIVNKKVDTNKLSAKDLIEHVKQESNKVTDTSQLSTWVDEAVANNPSAVEDFKAGKQASLQFLMGQVMKLSRGQASPKDVMTLLKKKLS